MNPRECEDNERAFSDILSDFEFCIDVVACQLFP